MKKFILLFFTSTILLTACSNDVSPKPSIEIDSPPSVSVKTKKVDNLIDDAAFKSNNAKFLASAGGAYSDTDSDGYAVLNAGSYTSQGDAVFQACVRLDATDANPAMRIRGDGGKLHITAILMKSGTDVGLKINKGEGEAKLVNGKTCVTTASLPAGTELNVSIYPAINTSGAGYDKSATGDVRVDDIVLEWIEK